jgi:hypothetical protein
MSGLLKYKKILVAILGISLVSSSCLKRIDIPEEGADARDAMKSTVKIYAKVKGHKKNIVSKPGTEEMEEVDGGEEVIRWVGSGVVVENDFDRNESLILSAAHVTLMGDKTSLHLEDDIHLFVAESITLTVETLDGTRCEAEQLAANKKLDISAIKSKCIAGRAARLGNSLPPVGAFVMVSGAALGIHPPNIFIVTDGRYMGIDQESNEELITLPVAGGHSGSGIYYRGEVVGIVSKRTIGYEHITLCVTLQNAKELYNSAFKIWELQKLNSLDNEKK